MNFEASEYSKDTETLSRLISVDEILIHKFRETNQRRYRNFNMMCSDKQWNRTSKLKLQNEKRPANAYNILSPTMKVISGLEKINRKRLNILGNTEDDEKYALVMNAALDWYLNHADWDWQKSRAALDAFIASWGVIKTGWSYVNDPQGQLVIRRINPFRLKFETDFTDATMKDCDLIQDGLWLGIDQILENYAADNFELWEEIEQKAAYWRMNEPEAVKRAGYVSSVMSKLNNDGVNLTVSDGASDDYDDVIMNTTTKWYDEKTDRFRVLEYHENRTKKKMILKEQVTGEEWDITKQVQTEDERGYDNDKVQEIRSRFEMPTIRRDIGREKYITTILPALYLKLQDEPYPLQDDYYNYQLLFAYDFHTNIENVQSVVDELHDPQVSYNKRKSTALEYLNRMSSIGYVLEEGADDTYEEEWKNRQIGGVRHVRTGFFDRWKQDHPPALNQQLAQIEMQERAEIEDISGVNKSQKGQQESAGMPARLFEAKREQGDLMLEYLFDNIDFATLHIGRRSTSLIQHYATEERIHRITRDVDKPYDLVVNQRTVEGIKNDLSKGKFDFEVSHAPYSRTAKQVEYLKLLDLMDYVKEIAPQMAMTMLPILIKASENAYKNELLAIVNQQLQINDVELQAQAAEKIIAQLQNEQEYKSKEMELYGQKQQLDMDAQVTDTMKNNKTMQN